MKRFFAVCLLLSACGGGSDENPVSGSPMDPCANSTDPFCIPSAAPVAMSGVDTRTDSLEVDVGSFVAYYALSDRPGNIPRQPGRATVQSGTFDIWSTDAGEMRMITPSGNRYLFETGNIVPLSEEVEYQYDVSDGGGDTLVIRRSQNGSRYGYYLLGPVGAVTTRRGSFYYGWKTDVANLPSGTAVYSSPQGGQLFTSDGRRIFGRPTTLVADFAANTVSGTLFDNRKSTVDSTPGLIYDPGFDFDLEAHVTIQGAAISGADVNATSGMAISLADSQDAITINSSVANAKLQGAFIGPNAQVISGSFSGEVNITQPTAGASTFGFAGIFGGKRP